MCQHCAQSWLATKKDTSETCPACGSDTHRPSEFLVNPFADGLIRQLTICCPLQCNDTKLVIGTGERAIIDHLTNHCPQRPQPCVHGCAGLFRPAELPRHQREDDCRGRLVVCRQGCYEPKAGTVGVVVSFDLRDNGRFRPSPWVKGMRLDAQDSSGSWMVAKVEGEQRQGASARLSVRFLGWAGDYTESVDPASARLAPLRTHSTEESEELQLDPSSIANVPLAAQRLRSGFGEREKKRKWQLNDEDDDGAVELDPDSPLQLSESSISSKSSSSSSSSAYSSLSSWTSSSSSSSSSAAPTAPALVPTRLPLNRVAEHEALHCPVAKGACSACPRQLRRCDMNAHRQTDKHRIQRLTKELEARTKAMEPLMADPLRTLSSAEAAGVRSVIRGLQDWPLFVVAAAADAPGAGR